MSFSRVLLVAFFVLVTVLTVAGFLYGPSQPPVASRHGEDVDYVIRYLLITTGVVFVIGHAALGWMIWRHAGEGPSVYRPVSRKTELMWAIVPVLIMAVISEAGVLVMALPVWDQLYGKLPEDALRVEVVGKQFEWFVRYPGKDGKFGRFDPELVHETRNPIGLDEDDPAAADDIVLRGALYLPVDRAVSVNLRSHDVLHSFTVPSFRIKQDLIPGFTTHTQFTPTKVGTYEIACAELCGLGHYRMRGVVHVTSHAEFEAWLGKQEGWFE